MFEIINSDKAKLDCYHVLTFQPREIVEKLMTDGVYSDDMFYGKRIKEIHEDVYDTVPIYTFLTLGSDLGICEINLPSFYKDWCFFMGYMQLDNRDIIEMYIPKTEHVIINAVDETLYESDIPQKYTGTVELVIDHLEKNWVSAIYTKSTLNSGYGKVTLTPKVYMPDAVILHDKPFRVSGDGRAEDNIYSLLPRVIPAGKRINTLCLFVKPTIRLLYLMYKILRKHRELAPCIIKKMDYDKRSALFSEFDFEYTDSEDIAKFKIWANDVYDAGL